MPARAPPAPAPSGTTARFFSFARQRVALAQQRRDRAERASRMAQHRARREPQRRRTGERDPHHLGGHAGIPDRARPAATSGTSSTFVECGRERAQLGVEERLAQTVRILRRDDAEPHSILCSTRARPLLGGGLARRARERRRLRSVADVGIDRAPERRADERPLEDAVEPVRERRRPRRSSPAHTARLIADPGVRAQQQRADEVDERRVDQVQAVRERAEERRPGAARAAAPGKMPLVADAPR